MDLRQKFKPDSEFSQSAYFLLDKFCTKHSAVMLSEIHALLPNSFIEHNSVINRAMRAIFLFLFISDNWGIRSLQRTIYK